MDPQQKQLVEAYQKTYEAAVSKPTEEADEALATRLAGLNVQTVPQAEALGKAEGEHKASGASAPGGQVSQVGSQPVGSRTEKTTPAAAKPKA